MVRFMVQTAMELELDSFEPDQSLAHGQNRTEGPVLGSANVAPDQTRL